MQSATADELVRLGSEIHAAARRAEQRLLEKAELELPAEALPPPPRGKKTRPPPSKQRELSKKQRESLHDILRKEYKDFAHSFPIVVNWIANVGEYSPKAFRNFLQRHPDTQWENRKDFIEAQGDYLTFLFRELHPEYTASQRKKYRRNVKNQLHKDDRVFTDANDRAAEAEKEARAEADRARRARLRAQLLALSDRLQGERPRGPE